MSILIVGLVALGALLAMLHRRQMAHWALPATAHAVRNFFVRRPVRTHVLFCFVDHFEPSRGDASPELAAARLQRWLDRFPPIALEHRDAAGRPAQHTWFYPFDEWRDGEVAALSALCYEGLGEIELHLHHDGDRADTLRATLTAALAAFGRHGALLGVGDPTVPRFGFIHGNWALDNSRPDGRWCGVNEELTVLAEAGCYADFTLPTPDRTQPRRVNTIYRAVDDPDRPRSHEWGAAVVAGRPGEGLMLIPGPLGLNWRDWHHRWYPALERGEIAAPSPVTPARVAFWLRTRVGVRGRPDWVFVKVYAHGCLERDQEELLGAGRRRLHEILETICGSQHALWYCTAREMYNVARAAEDGRTGEPVEYFDYALPPPVNRVLRATGPVDVTALTATHGEVAAVGDGEVRWESAIGPVRRIEGAVSRLSWSGGEVRVEARGDYRLERR